MKTKLFPLCTAMLLAAFCANAMDAKPVAKLGSPEFERMKTLVGSWAGKVDMGGNPVDMDLSYRLLAGGSVVEERCFAGTPNEMTTMFYDQGGKLAATHYCALGNRPKFLLKSSDAKSITFDFDKTCGINAKKESHMHSLTLTFNDASTVTMNCRAIMDGKEVIPHDTVLKRVK
ncbi:MAG: hypothetical protein RLZZ350_2409 [Verrucomicrobiota bacterium]|jgi:hypothetical protein